MKTIRRTLIVAVALVIISGSFACASAREWVWDDPYLVATNVTRIVAGDELYGIDQAGNISPLPLSLAEPGVAATAGPVSQVLDIGVGPGDTVFAVMGGLVATWSAPSVFTALVQQPKVPESPGSYKQIAVGSNGYIYVLFQKQTGAQCILRGRELSEELTVRFEPRTLDLNSRGNWILCKLRLPDGYSEKDIDPDSVEITRIQAPVPGGAPIDISVSILRAPDSRARASTRQLDLRFLRYDKGNPDNPQSLNAVLTGILPAPALKKITYPVTATVLLQLKTTGEWFEGTGTLNVTVHKAK
ncbi:MAG TPA: hypothetical protein VGJ94_17305 [Syntrophorhabdaceae bacterium]|jgi:hypothetical protein